MNLTFNYGTKVTGELVAKLFVLCQGNPWLKVGGVDFKDGLICEHDAILALYEYETLEDVKAFFEHGNWSIRAAVKYKDLIFVNQVNGGDEWLTIKIVDGELYEFESVSWGHMLARPKDDPYTFDQFMTRCLAAKLVAGRIVLPE